MTDTGTDMTARSALLLTAREWRSLRTVAEQFLADTEWTVTHAGFSPIGDIARARDLCSRIIEVTEHD